MFYYITVTILPVYHGINTHSPHRCTVIFIPNFTLWITSDWFNRGLRRQLPVWFNDIVLLSRVLCVRNDLSVYYIYAVLHPTRYASRCMWSTCFHHSFVMTNYTECHHDRIVGSWVKKIPWKHPKRQTLSWCVQHANLRHILYQWTNFYIPLKPEWFFWNELNILRTIFFICELLPLA